MSFLRRVPRSTTSPNGGGKRIEIKSCPGGPRMRAADIKNLYKVNKCYDLPKEDNGNRFLNNLMLTHNIVTNMKDTTDKILMELGTGPGSLTRSLLTRPSRGVLGVELDTRYNSYLESIQRHTRHKFRWCNADAMNMDEPQVLREAFPEMASSIARPWASPASVLVVSSLPFRLQSQLLVKYALEASRKSGLYSLGSVHLRVTIQQEVAECICAVQSTTPFGMLSVVMQNYFSCHIESVIKGEKCYPYAAVNIAVLTLVPRPVPLVEIDGAALLTFATSQMQRSRWDVEKGLLKCMPPEVAAFILREVGVDPRVNLRDLSGTTIAKMALLWVRFLEATNQPVPDVSKLKE